MFSISQKRLDLGSLLSRVSLVKNWVCCGDASFLRDFSLYFLTCRKNLFWEASEQKSSVKFNSFYFETFCMICRMEYESLIGLASSDKCLDSSPFCYLSYRSSCMLTLLNIYLHLASSDSIFRVYSKFLIALLKLGIVWILADFITMDCLDLCLWKFEGFCQGLLYPAPSAFALETPSASSLSCSPSYTSGWEKSKYFSIKVSFRCLPSCLA